MRRNVFDAMRQVRLAYEVARRSMVQRKGQSVVKVRQFVSLADVRALYLSKQAL